MHLTIFQKLSILINIYIYTQVVDLEAIKSINSSIFKGTIYSTDNKNSNQSSGQFFFFLQRIEQFKSQ